MVTVLKSQRNAVRQIFSNPSVASELMRFSRPRPEWITNSREKWAALVESPLFGIVNEAVEKNTPPGSTKDQEKNVHFFDQLIFDVMLFLETKVEDVRRQWETITAEQLQEALQQELDKAEEKLQTSVEEQQLLDEDENLSPEKEELAPPKINNSSLKITTSGTEMILVVNHDSPKQFYAENDDSTKTDEVPKDPQYYESLDLKPDASRSEIRKAYLKQALINHPDKAPDDPKAGEKFKKINEAYEVLYDPQQRERYDQYRASLSQSNISAPKI